MAILENDIVRTLQAWPTDGLTGRTKILTTAKRITADNVLDVLSQTLAVHNTNVTQINYLWNYYAGSQDVRNKKKYVRENINNKVTVNRANQIVTFKTAFVLEEPIQYISHGGDENVSKRVNRLNELMRCVDKESLDIEIVTWMHICGVGVRAVLVADDPEKTGAPFDVYTIDPRRGYGIYYDGIGQPQIGGVFIGRAEDGTAEYDVYTPDRHFWIVGDSVTDLGDPQYGGIPLIEYENNMGRMGSFEPVIPILNSINQLESNAVDSVEDFVNGFDVFQNCVIEDGDYSQLSIGGKAIMIKTVSQGSEAKVYRIASEIQQSGVQTRIDDLTDAYIEICGLPNRNGGSSTSDTGTAVLFRDGWSEAASRARETAKMFRKAEKTFDRIVLNICRTQNERDLPELSEFDTEFPRGKLANMQAKAQVLCELLNQKMVHPKYAYQVSDLFDDREAAYRAGLEWQEEQEKKTEEQLLRSMDREVTTETVPAGRSDDSGAEPENGQKADADEGGAE